MYVLAVCACMHPCAFICMCLCICVQACVIGVFLHTASTLVLEKRTVCNSSWQRLCWGELVFRLKHLSPLGLPTGNSKLLVRPAHSRSKRVRTAWIRAGLLPCTPNCILLEHLWVLACPVSSSPVIFPHLPPSLLIPQLLPHLFGEVLPGCPGPARFQKHPHSCLPGT